jgi:hypothetical protein
MNPTDRRPGIRSAWWPWGATLAALLLGALVAAWYRRIQEAPVPANTLLFAGGIFALFAWLGFLTWHVLRRREARAPSERIYHLGVRRFGVAMWVGSALLLALRSVQVRTGGRLLTEELGFELLLRLIINAPIALWAGYFFGWTVARIVDAPKRK